MRKDLTAFVVGNISIFLLAGLLIGCRTTPHQPDLPDSGTTIPNSAFTNNFAVVRAVRGEGFLGQRGDSGSPVKIGKKLAPGDELWTTDGSSLDLFLGVNGPVVRVTEKTELQIEELGATPGDGGTVARTRLHLKSGRILGNVKRLLPESIYEVKTPVGTALVREGQYDINANGTVSVVTGEVLVKDRGGSHTVKAGHTHRTPRGPRR